MRPAAKGREQLSKDARKNKPPKDSPLENYCKGGEGQYVAIPEYVQAPATSGITLDVDKSSITHPITLPEK